MVFETKIDGIFWPLPLLFPRWEKARARERAKDECHLTFYALQHMHKRSCRRLRTRYQVLFRSRPQRSCDVRYYCWCHYYLRSLAQPTDASQSAGCLESVVYVRIEIGVCIWFLEIANLSTRASVFTGFSTVCFHSPEAFGVRSWLNNQFWACNKQMPDWCSPWEGTAAAAAHTVC